MHIPVQDVATALESTLDLPSILPHGARVDPTADGFLIWLPTCESPPSKPAEPPPQTAERSSESRSAISNALQLESLDLH